MATSEAELEDEIDEWVIHENSGASKKYQGPELFHTKYKRHADYNAHYIVGVDRGIWVCYSCRKTVPRAIVDVAVLAGCKQFVDQPNGTRIYKKP